MLEEEPYKDWLNVLPAVLFPGSKLKRKYFIHIYIIFIYLIHSNFISVFSGNF